MECERLTGEGVKIVPENKKQEAYLVMHLHCISFSAYTGVIYVLYVILHI